MKTGRGMAASRAPVRGTAECRDIGLPTIEQLHWLADKCISSVEVLSSLARPAFGRSGARFRVVMVLHQVRVFCRVVVEIA